MFKKSLFIFLLLGMTVIAGAEPAVKTVVLQEPPAKGERVLPLEEFLSLATEKDTEFEQILIDELTLQYQKALLLPAGDLVLSVVHRHEFYLDQDRDSPDTTVSLSKLFPYTGIEIGLDYEAGATVSSAATVSKGSVSISQPIAQNAFGRSTRWLDRIVGLETDVASHQIIEAYEDYMAVILDAYYDWYADHENLKVARSSYESNLQLLENMQERRRQKVALPVDVNKVKLQVMSKKERLIELEEQYKNSLNLIERIVRYEDDKPLVPVYPEAVGDLTAKFRPAFDEFHDGSRTFDILRMLEEKSSLQVARDADDLLPSIDLLVGYEVSGENYGIRNEDDLLYAGVELDWPFGHQVEHAEYEISKITERRRELITTNTYYRLYTQLLNLYLQIEREKKLIAIADERIELALSILDDEAENYSFGKISLNDYIQAVNDLDTNRFNKISHESLYKQLLVEWYRLLDKLVQEVP